MKPEFSMEQIRSFDRKGFRSVAARMVRSLLQHIDAPVDPDECNHERTMSQGPHRAVICKDCGHEL